MPSRSQRDEHVLGGPRDPDPGRDRAGVDRAHVVQPVGQLDDQHPDVGPGRHDHLPDGLDLGVRAVEGPVELGHAVDDQGHFAAERVAQLRHRVAGVLDRVVQQGRDQGGGVHAQLGQDLRDGQRMGDVRLAALAHLPPVHALGDVVRAAHQRPVAVAVQVPVGAHEVGHGVGELGRPDDGPADPVGEIFYPLERCQGRPGTPAEVEFHGHLRAACQGVSAFQPTDICMGRSDCSLPSTDYFAW